VNQVLFACVQELALEIGAPAPRARAPHRDVLKLACVVQRYGAGVAGGSERHCRDIALRLAERHDVTILTTCAADYVTWENEFPAGDDDGRPRDGAPLSRCKQPRRLKRFADLSDEVFDGPRPTPAGRMVRERTGPTAPRSSTTCAPRDSSYDLVLFWTFRYAPSFFGVPLVRDRAVLLPTAEEDRAVT
jgi:hypothetical protein